MGIYFSIVYRTKKNPLKVDFLMLAGVAQWIAEWVLACEPKGRRFDSQAGHMPGLQARSPVGGT